MVLEISKNFQFYFCISFTFYSKLTLKPDFLTFLLKLTRFEENQTKNVLFAFALDGLMDSQRFM